MGRFFGCGTAIPKPLNSLIRKVASPVLCERERGKGEKEGGSWEKFFSSGLAALEGGGLHGDGTLVLVLAIPKPSNRSTGRVVLRLSANRSYEQGYRLYFGMETSGCRVQPPVLGMSLRNVRVTGLSTEGCDWWMVTS